VKVRRPRSEYLKLWAASAISSLGDGIGGIAAPLLAAALTRDPAQVAGMSFVEQLPWLLFGLISGAIVDRFDRRIIMGIVDLLRMTLMGILALAVLGNWASIPLLYAVFFLLGSADTLFGNASQTILPQIVDHDQLEHANSRLYTAELVNNNFVGPPLGGLLFAAARPIPFLADAVSFAASSLLVLLLRGRFSPERVVGAPRTTLRAEIIEGLKSLWVHNTLRTLAIMVGIMNLLTTSALAVFVLFVRSELGLGGLGFGLLISSGALGGLAGTLVVDRIIRRVGADRALFGSFLTNAATFAVIAFSRNAFIVGAMLAISALSTVAWNVITVSFRQTAVPKEILGRVNSVYRLLASGGTAIGALIGGFIARGFGLVAPYWIAAIALAITSGALLPIVRAGTISRSRAREALVGPDA